MPDRRQQAASFMRGAGWLSRLPSESQQALLDTARYLRVEGGTPLFQVSDPPGGMYGLASGCVAAESDQSDNAPQKATLLHPGAWFGEGNIAGLDARLVGARATRQSELFFIEIAGFRKVAGRFPDIWRHLVLLSLENHTRTMGLALDLMRRGSRERLTAILVALAGLRHSPRPKPAIIDATQSEIAAIANLSRSTVSELLPAMEREGLIALKRGAVEIADADRLIRSL